MKLVYTHENLFLVGNAKALLENAGIRVEIKNEFTGGGRGELPVFETWPELWVETAADYQRARTLLDAMQSTEQGAPWTCPQCDETNGPAFEVCWKCGTGRTSSCM